MNKSNTGFRGNINVKGGEETSTYSVEEYERAVKEIIKCKKDPVYFADSYFYIVSPGKGKHIIETYPKQKELIRAMHENNRVIVTSARQIGKTISYAIIVLHLCLFNLDKKVLILANKGDIALEIMSRIRLAYELLPNWIKPGVTVWNKRSIEFTNGSKIEASNTSPDAARGKSCNCLVLDECLTKNNYVTVRNNETGIIKVISMDELYNNYME